ncbi:biosynthetic-type acetolactate synthase large subunit [Microbacter margulisiae]|uniref:Acetolactate synthase n=1 Tax=Microbacter margulisiae TaxID=1350067 RepID=A0A7W5DT69_9PORP|nr:biosynthetic-type acetolactate synthase large subunit [Microbacter margulisiae]MBB3188620.1 acetolactate synthase-1/2/3 large subunit [Microbacter margulisiae]
MSNEKISGGEALMQAFLAEGVETIFGYPGGAIMPAYDALYDFRDKLRHVLVRHEQGAAHAAEGYARVTGKTGVVLVTSGPAATNVITGVTDAMIDSTPMVVVTGQVVSSLLATDAFQETDVVGITQPITKWSYQIRSASEIAWAVARAFYIAREGRPGPVVLDLTKNAQTELIDFQYEKCTFIRSYIPFPKPDKKYIEEAAKIINQSVRPYAIIGQGVILGNAEKEVLAFLEKAQIPVASTLLGLSAIPSQHPLFKGMPGMHGKYSCNVKMNECDVLIGIGMRFDDRITSTLDSFAKQATVLHFDVDPAEMHKNVKAHVPVLGNVKETIPLVTELLNKGNHDEWIKSFDSYDTIEYEEVIKEELNPTSNDIKMGEVINKISGKTHHDAIFVTDVGQNQMMGARYSQFTKSRSFVTSGGLGTMGFGLPAAVGAKIGSPERIVCLFSGDGGFQMSIQELGTIMQEHIGVKMVVLNNNFLGMVRQWQEMFFDERYSFTTMHNPDFVAIAAAYGIKGKHIKNHDELDSAIEEMFKDDEPYLLEVKIEPKGMVFPMVPSGAPISDVRLK